MPKKNNDDYYRPDYEAPPEEIEDLAGSTKISSSSEISPSENDVPEEILEIDEKDDPVLRYWKKRLIYTWVFACFGVLLAIGLTIYLIIELV